MKKIFKTIITMHLKNDHLLSGIEKILFDICYQNPTKKINIGCELKMTLTLSLIKQTNNLIAHFIKSRMIGKQWLLHADLLSTY